MWCFMSSANGGAGRPETTLPCEAGKDKNTHRTAPAAPAKRAGLFADVFIPQRRVRLDEAAHQLYAGRIVQVEHFDTRLCQHILEA